MKRLEDLHGVLLGNITTIEATYHIAKAALELDVPGDFVECGVFAGAQSAAMARAISETAPGGRKVHLFDSFQGLPEPGEHDADMRRDGHHRGGSACTLTQVKQYMHDWNIPQELLVYHPGWFSDTMPPKAPLTRDMPERIAVLRIDCDLYESTELVMRHLYPRVVAGGWIIADDWNLDGFRKAINAFLNPAPIYWRKDG